MPTLYLRNVEQVAIFKFEICGQLSDGHWENSRPHNHWQDWGRCEVRVAPEGVKPSRNFYVIRDVYGLTSKALLDCVGGRMIGQARLARALGLEIATEIEGVVHCGDVPYEPKYNDTYIDKTKLSGHSRQTLVGYIEFAGVSAKYGKKELLKDLREIKAAMRNYVPTKDIVVPSVSPSLQAPEVVG